MYILNESYLQQFSVNKKFDFKETDTKPQRFFFYFVSCIDLNHSKTGRYFHRKYRR